MTQAFKPEPKILPAIIIASLAALMSTLLGIGGGSVMVPLLTLFAGMEIKRTTGTSLAVIVVVIAVGLLAQQLRAPADIHLDIAALLSAGAIVGAFIGRKLNQLIPSGVFRYAFCAVMLLIGIRMLGLLPTGDALLHEAPELSNPADIVFLLGVGLTAGITSALFGLGGGIVVVPALAIAYGFFHDNFTATRATSLAMILPTSLVGTILHWRAKNVDMRLVSKLTPFALVFAVVGVLLAYVVPTFWLKVIFGALVLAAAGRLAFKNRRPKPAKKS